METWWSRYPDALVAEKASLDALGHRWSIDEAAKQAGRLVIHVEIPHEGGAFKLRAVYPDTFPYFQPQVFLDGPALDRHQHPIGKNLCLLAREGEDWRPGHDTLAVLLREQFPIIQAVNTADVSSAFVADHEDHVGEALSSFLPSHPNCTIIVPDDTPPAELAAGKLALQVRGLSSNLEEGLFVSGVVQKITDLAGRNLVEFPITAAAFPQTLAGFWMRLHERPQIKHGQQLEQQFLDVMRSTVPAFQKALDNAKRGQTIVAGFVYPDELSWRGSTDDWIFLAIRIQREAKGSRLGSAQQQFIRTDWGGEQAWMRRAPALRPLRSKTAVILGLGSLGSPLTLHLARAGIGRLHLVDCDQLQVGNTIRWALGWQYAGLRKAFALARHVSLDYPYTAATSYECRIGAPAEPTESFFSDYQFIRSIAQQADLIVDATANQRVSHFLADLAQEIGKPYLWLTTTHGGAGGVVGRIRPGKTPGCWHCFQHGLADRSIRLPADIGSDEIQPGGCSQPTFIGAGIDSDEIALLAARLAVATLCAGENGGYPDFTWDVAVADLARESHSIAPDWTSYVLERNTACSVCNPA